MLHRIVAASTLALSLVQFVPFVPALAADTIGQPAVAADTTGQPGRGGDGHCPIPGLATDPDCAREGTQTLSKSSRDEFPACRNWRAGQPRPAGCRRASVFGALLAGESDKRDQFPGGRPPQPGHLG